MQTRVAEDAESLAELLDELFWGYPGKVAIDFEWDRPKGWEGTALNHADIFLGSLAYRELYSDELVGWLIWPQCLPGLKEWLEDPSIPKVGHNLLHADAHALANHGITLRGVVMDTLVGSRLLNPSKHFGHKLKPDWAERVGWKSSVKYKDVMSRPLHSDTPQVYKRTLTSKKKHCPGCYSKKLQRLSDGGLFFCEKCGWAGPEPRVVNYHYTEGAEVYNISWSQREEIRPTELWEKYPERRQKFLDYACQDAILHLLVAEEQERLLAEVKW